MSEQRPPVRDPEPRKLRPEDLYPRKRDDQTGKVLWTAGIVFLMLLAVGAWGLAAAAVIFVLTGVIAFIWSSSKYP